MNRYAFLPVQAYGETDYAWIDSDLAAELERYPWHTQGGCYAATTAIGLMHRYVMGLARGDELVVHHINEDSLDNRRENLQLTRRDVHGRLPHPRRDARSHARHARHAGIAPILPIHARQVALLANQQVAA